MGPDRRPVGPTVGLVIAAYQGADFIDQTLASVAAQTVVPDRVVVVDDASGDDTARRAARWSDLLPLEVVVQPVNGGVARARNAGAARLDTDLVTFLDGDDVLLPDHVVVLATLHHRCGGIVSPRASFWTPGATPRPYQRRVRGFVPPARHHLERLLSRNYVFIASLLARRDFEQVGGFTEGGRDQDMTADWDLWLRLVARGATVTLAPFPTVLYRVVEGSMADDPTRLLECEIAQLERTRGFVPAGLGATIDRAVARRQAELDVLRLTRQRAGIGLVRRVIGRQGGDWRNRSRALTAAVAPPLADRFIRRRGRW